MSRIAVGGFHHETNSFVAPDTDFAYFVSHRDRPPLVRGADVVRSLCNTSFALSGFLDEIGDRHEIAPLLWTSGGAGGTVTADAFERIAGELARRLSEAMPVDGVYLDLHGAMVTILRGWRRGAVAARSGGSRCACADCDQPRLPRERHARDGRARGQRRRLSDLSPCRPGRDRRLRGEGSLAPPRTRPSGGARASQAALPHSAERSMHAGRAVAERCCPHRRGRGRSRKSFLS